MGGFSFSSSPFFLYTDLNVKCSLIMTTTVEISQTDSGGMNLDLCFASQCIYALPLSVQRRPVELYDISVHTGQLCPFSLSVFFFPLAFSAASVPCSLVGADKDYSGSGKIWASLIIAHCLYCHSVTK